MFYSPLKIAEKNKIIGAYEEQEESEQIKPISHAKRPSSFVEDQEYDTVEMNLYNTFSELTVKDAGIITVSLKK